MMNDLLWIVLSTSLITLFAGIGSLTLFLRERILRKILLVLVAFSAGALIGGAFLHLIPEAVMKIGMDETTILVAFSFLLIGFSMFFVLEQIIRWHHHHATAHPDIMPFSYLVLIGDGIHNLIDGIVIAASFMVSVQVGISTALAVALHEIPQEIGDFGVLVYGGIEKKKALMLNYISALTVLLGGILGYLLSDLIGESIVFLLPFAAGNFIYIATTDLIPEIRHGESFSQSLTRFGIFVGGMGLMALIRFIAH